MLRRKTRPSLLIFTMIGNDGVSNDLQPAASLERTRSSGVCDYPSIDVSVAIYPYREFKKKARRVK